MSIFAHAGYWTGDMSVDEFVAERSKIATQHKADGVISSPLEVPAIRAAVTRPDFHRRSHLQFLLPSNPPS
jgi:hypothetical protein